MSIGPTRVILPSGIEAFAEAIFDANGIQLSGFDPSKPSTGAGTNVPASVTAVTILAANPARKRFTVLNNSSKTLYLFFGTGATLPSNATPLVTEVVPAQQAYRGLLNDYTGLVSGIWAAGATGDAIITELT